MNTNLLKKDKKEGVSFPVIDLEHERPCLANESVVVSDTVDTLEEGRRMSRRKKAKVFIFLTILLQSDLSNTVLSEDTVLTYWIILRCMHCVHVIWFFVHVSN
jgi:hypothetical protein